jgi:hypothetical protein
LIRLLTFTAGRHGLGYGVAAAVDHRQALTVVDVRANEGQFALFATGYWVVSWRTSRFPIHEHARRPDEPDD